MCPRMIQKRKRGRRARRGRGMHSCNTCSLCQDRVQTRRMSPLNFNSQPQSPATDAARPGCGTSGAAVPDVRGVTGTPVLSADLSGSITGCNQAALEVFGQRPQAGLGRTLAALVFCLRVERDSFNCIRPCPLRF